MDGSNVTSRTAPWWAPWRPGPLCTLPRTRACKGQLSGGLRVKRRAGARAGGSGQTDRETQDELQAMRSVSKTTPNPFSLCHGGQQSLPQNNTGVAGEMKMETKTVCVCVSVHIYAHVYVYA